MILTEYLFLRRVFFWAVGIGVFGIVSLLFCASQKSSNEIIQKCNNDVAFQKDRNIDAGGSDTMAPKSPPPIPEVTYYKPHRDVPTFSISGTLDLERCTGLIDSFFREIGYPPFDSPYEILKQQGIKADSVQWRTRFRWPPDRPLCNNKILISKSFFIKLHHANSRTMADFYIFAQCVPYHDNIWDTCQIDQCLENSLKNDTLAKLGAILRQRK